MRAAAAVVSVQHDCASCPAVLDILNCCLPHAPAGPVPAHVQQPAAAVSTAPAATTAACADPCPAPAWGCWVHSAPLWPAAWVYNAGQLQLAAQAVALVVFAAAAVALVAAAAAAAAAAAVRAASSAWHTLLAAQPADALLLAVLMPSQ